MMKRMLYILPLLALACAATLVGSTTDRSAAPGTISIAARLAPGDSVTFLASWTAPTLTQLNLPIAGYRVEWLHGTSVQEAHDVTGLSDSLRVLRPPVGDSIGPLFVRVRSRDTAGALSDWATSSEFWLTTFAAPPPPPGSVQLDTLRLASEMLMLPQVLSRDGSTSVELCAFSRSSAGGWRVYPALPVCTVRLQAYLARQAQPPPAAVAE